MYISHKMDEIKVIADEVTIMRDGQYIGKWMWPICPRRTSFPKMVGRELSNLFIPRWRTPSDEVMMKVENFTSKSIPAPSATAALSCTKGEILGVAGLVGAQRTELMEGIFGLRAHTEGKVWIKGEEVKIKPPATPSKERGSADRGPPCYRHPGVLSVADNISIASLDRCARAPSCWTTSASWIWCSPNKEKMAIKVPSPKTQIKSCPAATSRRC